MIKPALSVVAILLELFSDFRRARRDLRRKAKYPIQPRKPTKED